MRLLLDTHTVIWAVDDPAKLGTQASQALQDPGNDLLISAATIWELSIKVGLGKLSLSNPYRTWMDRAIHDLGAMLVPITVPFADVQGRLPFHHRDPFDRMLIAQAKVENTPLVSGDGVFDQYGIRRIW